jgi:hypothetical protein
MLTNEGDRDVLLVVAVVLSITLAVYNSYHVCEMFDKM